MTMTEASRYQPCPPPGCGDPADTWLAGTTAAHRTVQGVMHADCYLNLNLTDAGRCRCRGCRYCIAETGRCCCESPPPAQNDRPGADS